MGTNEKLLVMANSEYGEKTANSIEVKQSVTTDGGDVDVVTGGSNGNGNNSRVWTMRDLLTKYPGYRGYANSGLYNFAWAQAVQNKPLSEGLGIELKESDDKIESDGEKEEGELEEGELEEGETDLEFVEVDKEGETELVSSVVVVDDDDEQIQKERDLEERVKLIRCVLESTSLVEAQTAFEGVCCRLIGALESLRKLVLDNKDDFPKRDTLVQLSFASLQTINSVFYAMDGVSKENNKETMSRVLSLVHNHFSQFLSSHQINEIETMKQNLTITEENVNRMTQTTTPRGGAFYLRNRLPLLDLHKDHDADSLPSPTRETVPSIPVNGRPMMFKGQTNESGGGKVYGSEAVKAVSTYQKKFGINTTMFKTDDLPSPTPSGEEQPNDDISGEVSSSKPGSLMMYGQDVPPLPSNVNPRSVPVGPHYMSMHGVSAPTAATQTVLASNQTVKPSAKSRDPRLRLVKPDSANVTVKPHSSGDPRKPSEDLTNPRKQKASDEAVIGEPSWKRQKSDKDTPKVTGIGGWLEDTESPALPNPVPQPVTSMTTSAAVSVNQQAPTEEATLLSTLLKDIAVNPTMLQIQKILQMREKQKATEKVTTQKPIDPRRAAQVTQKPIDPRRAAQLPGSSVSPGVTPLPLVIPPASNASATNISKPGVPQDESGSIPMKRRDPRRILHETSLQRTDSSIENTPIIGNLGMKRKIEEVETPSQLVPRQNSASKMKMSDMIVTSQQVGNPLEVKQKPSSPISREESLSVSAPSVTTARSTTNSWGEVEHLFEGYDNTERVAIQKERARRLDEQKKMFASKKLSLVLDIDHTLLNSAKFHEVEPAHDEKLRNKEEKDREKPYRHLFRFSHMGMWTKLRPGIWNFLEKASELYELHLYTMGNKLYATEMAKLLDPKGILFNGRVISKGDEGDLLDGDERVPKSKDLEGVMGMESSVVIIDDSVRVWPHNKMNLIAVERYCYFPCSRRQFGLLGPSLLEVDHDEVPEEGTLASSLAVIERIHRNFFSHDSLDEADVRNILACEQHKILGGCRIVFSRIIPVGEAKPHLHPLWQLAEQFGAVCTTQIDENVTHVVTNSLGTDKVNWAYARGKFVVHHGWVEASAFLYRRANEKDFPINP